MHDNSGNTRSAQLASTVTVCCAALVAAASASVSAASQETVLYSFTGGADGANPFAGLIADSAGNLYGTTYHGGAAGYGTVFKLTPSGTETVLHSFGGPPDGANPFAGLIDDSVGNLYGTTAGGGVIGYGCTGPSGGYGTVFKVTPSGTESVLYSFAGYPDAACPIASVFADAAGNLYGTTDIGGTSDYGTVFKVTPSGTESVLYSFTGGADGANPFAGLIADSASNLYGTSAGGPPSDRYGTVFKLTPSGTETVLHSFGGPPDGATSFAGLIADSAGNFYGTTYRGGTSGSGTVFKVTPSGTESVLYSFTGGADGANPYAGLIADSAGNLYGTTTGGGASGYGTVFKVTPSGTETVLYSFTGGADGANPYAGLIADSAGNLYGTTQAGGTSDWGTVYKLTGAFTAFVCTIAPANTAIPGAPVSWNKFRANAPDVVWVDAHIGTPSGVPTTSVTTVEFTGVSLTVNGTSYSLPNGTLTFDPSAPATPSTTFNSTTGWTTTVNPNDLSDEIFFDGQAIPVNSNLTGGGRATLSFTTQSTDNSLAFNWQWSAAAYTYWPSNSAADILAYHNSLQAGSPLNTEVQQSLIGGPRGGGGSNYTGGWSGTGQGACPGAQ